MRHENNLPLWHICMYICFCISTVCRVGLTSFWLDVSDHDTVAKILCASQFAICMLSLCLAKYRLFFFLKHMFVFWHEVKSWRSAG
jgi:hypothetical protein